MITTTAEAGGASEKPAPSQPQNEYTRERALALLHEWTQSPSLLKHAFAVETCTAAYGQQEAERLGLSGTAAEAFVEPYRIAALLHDFDYEKHPSLDEHVWVGIKVLEQQGWPEPIRHAILAHAEYTHTPRESHLDRALFACDELSGFLTACALVKPSRSIHDVEVAGVRKKMKDKAFARGVLREDIVNGAALLGIEVDQHIANCLRAMQANAAALGLDGVPASDSAH
ncbi:HD domain-containing protein [Terriglobus aquaticus]|uniref:HD domain-containing protein n=1 Tax=Terriglobus aquaticus TaxID=940139 RepID=A0ABW9KGP1_9BACT|nr:HD domain-containing protein [Terriglobus aquaticus]